MRCILYLTIRCLQRPAPAPQAWRFDLLSALIGAAVACLLAGLAYVFRGPLRRGWEAVVALLARLLNYLKASAEEAYRQQVAAWARSLIVPAHVAPLDAIFVEPELLAPWPPPQSISEAESVHVGPQVLPLHRILGGHPRLVILGDAGKGRTTVLAYLALVCATAAGKGDERVEAGAMQELARERLPLYVSLSAMDWGEIDQESELEQGQQEAEQKQEGKQKSGAVGRLLGAAVAAVGGGGALSSPLRQHLEAGRAIVLADGWDELLPQQRQQAAIWLTELVGALPGNLWLVGAGTRGYAPLTDAGFVPLTLAPWDVGKVEEFAKRWVAACTPADEPSSASMRGLVAELQHAARRGASPLELSLRAFVYLSGHQIPVKRAALFDQALDLLLWQEQEQVQEEQPWLSAACRATLGQVALELQQGERATVSREEIEAMIEAVLPPAEERPARATALVLRALTGERGLLRPAGSNRYAFAHPLWQSYLAARQLVAVAPASLVERLEDPRWADVLRFYAELGDVGPLVAAWLRSPDDILHTRLYALSSWVGVAPKGAAWRDGAMAVLARTLLQSGPPAPARRALAEALATTGVPGVAYFLAQALQHPDSEVRAAAVLGLAKGGSESDLPAIEAALSDEDSAVREAAVHALTSLGVDAAKQRLEQVLLEGDDTLRPVAAGALVKYGRESADFLRQTVESEDMMTRRAAVFGLAQIGARDVLEKVMREDEQWIVRTAAATALEELEERERTPGITPPPEIEQLPWLISWAAAQGTGVGVGDAARRMLWRALSEGDVPARLAAAQVLTRVGRPDDVEPLRAALNHPDPIAVGAAFEALAEISRRYDLRIER